MDSSSNENCSPEPKMRWVPLVIFTIGAQALISYGKITLWIVLFSAYSPRETKFVIYIIRSHLTVYYTSLEFWHKNIMRRNAGCLLHSLRNLFLLFPVDKKRTMNIPGLYLFKLHGKIVWKKAQLNLFLIAIIIMQLQW